MDSRLIAGAYSQHFRALEKEELENSAMMDSLTRAKRLSHETNKRRKGQAQKRKQEAEREERRRRDILSKRREQQKQATENYQRSHIPPSARQGSSRISPRRHGGTALEDALRLIRGSPRSFRPRSGNDISPRNENGDPFEQCYLDRNYNHMLRPGSARQAQIIDPNKRSEMMDHSMRNVTSNKSLFDQQLEQQQIFLLEQQQKSLMEFNKAIRKEIEDDEAVQTRQQNYGEQYENKESDDIACMSSDSCSSIDSLECSKGSDPEKSNFINNNQNKPHENQKDIDGNSQYFGQQSEMFNVQVSGYDYAPEDQPACTSHIPLNQNITNTALHQGNVPDYGTPGHLSSLQNATTYVGVTKADLMRIENKGMHVHSKAYETPLKQFSQDSLMGSGSSISSLSTIKIPDSPSTTNQKQHDSTIPNSYCMAKDELVNRRMLEHQQLVAKPPVNSERNWHNGGSVPSTYVSSIPNHQTSWADPSSQHVTVPLTQTSEILQNDMMMADYNPRYASTIGLSIWPGHSTQYSPSSVSNILVNNQHPYSSRGTLTSATSIVSFPNLANSSSYSLAIDSSMKSLNTDQQNTFVSTGSSVMNSNSNLNNTNFADFNKDDLNNPTVQQNLQSGIRGTISDSQQSQVVPANTTGLVDITMITEVPRSSKSEVQSYQQLPLSTYEQQATTTARHVPTVISRVDQTDLSSTSVPVPAVRSAHMSTQPSAPTTGAVSTLSHNRAHSAPVTRTVHNVTAADEQSQEISKHSDKNTGQEDEDFQPLRGILKSTASKIVGQNSPKMDHGIAFPRDSLELTRVQLEKMGKKKSVHFADSHIEEVDEMDVVNEQSSKMLVVSNTGVPMYKAAMTRPVSAKVSSTSQRQSDAMKTTRVASAGTVRQAPVYTTMATSRTSTTTTSATFGINYINSNDNSSKMYNQISNLPPSNPLNVSLIDRPKAAAHIIMSTNIHPSGKSIPEHCPHSPTSTSVAMTAHKSDLDTKAKTISNNFMSKVPVEVSPVSTNTTGVVYHVAREVGLNPTSAVNRMNSDDIDRNKRDAFIQKVMQDRSKMTANKRVPISNANVSKTTVIPTSSKINIPQSTSGTPSYANITEDASTVPAYDENGLRIDRTPTDEEITWLWAKVRNCLTKEEEKNSNKTQGGSSGDQNPRPTPVLSTKIIDGASLGFGTNNGRLRTAGAGQFYRTSSAPSSQNKVKPSLQQPGTYSRRYGLLKQRRIQSASPMGPASTTGQRLRSTVYGRQNTQPTMVTQQNQQTQHDYKSPTPIAYSYKPEDNVSESTEAFVMAERLAKQSLSDSDIQDAMEEAHTKQELHNKVRTVNARGVQSALSIEEQRLMESLDKLNERLKGNDTKYYGTVHYHQAFQPHPPGFRGQHTMSDNSCRLTLSPRSQQRAQSARIRMQTRQYR